MEEVRPKQPNPPADWPDKFLAAYRKNGNISQSARTARVSRTTVWSRRSQDGRFAAAMADAQEEASDALEQEAWRRAKTGTLKPVFYKGKEVGQIREYSDTLLTVLLKGNRPDKFRDNARVELTGKDGAALFGEMSDDELDRRLAEAEGRKAEADLPG